MKCLLHQQHHIKRMERSTTYAPLMVLAAGAKATVHMSLMKILETKLKIPITNINNTFKQININNAQYTHSTLDYE